MAPQDYCIRLERSDGDRVYYLNALSPGDGDIWFESLTTASSKQLTSSPFDEHILKQETMERFETEARIVHRSESCDPGDYRSRLFNFYAEHNPTKLRDIDTTLARYKGQEDLLFQLLNVKYGVQTTDSFL